ncbi:MAG: ABC transporter permease [Firmicutes bacterium]|jgi:peptide/nickel transport system permease protein|nr:ABC transporter permease [Bacillota bacterium]HPU01383.1 ABC transporter permease [Bacillota bacterium]
MLRYIVRRLLWLIPVIILVSLAIYILMDLAPGTVIDSLITEQMTPEDIEKLRQEYDLDKPVIYRYGKYMWGLLHGDLGRSQVTGISVWESFMTRFPATLKLSLVSVVIGTVLAIPIGIFAARRAGTIWDNLTTGFTLIGQSMPSFWLGLLLLIAFAYKIQLFPAGGYRGPSSYVLPAVTSALMMTALTARQTRSSMLEVLRADYLRTARAKGVPERLVIRRHALKNAWIPILTTIGMGMSRFLAGSAVIETVFSWPGIGRLTVEAVSQRDVTLACGCVILTCILYVIVLLIVDLLYAFVDPRIKAQYASGGRRRKVTA